MTHHVTQQLVHQLWLGRLGLVGCFPSTKFAFNLHHTYTNPQTLWSCSFRTPHGAGLICSNTIYTHTVAAGYIRVSFSSLHHVHDTLS